VKAGITPLGGVLIAIMALLGLADVDARAVDFRASEAAVDRATQAALSLDAHPDRGASQFAHYCARCHGSQAQGDAGRAIPALAAQRFAYLVRQLANFAGGERESDTMHRVVSQKELQLPQSWVDIAAYLNRARLSVRRQTGDGTRLTVGRGIFQSQCATCHRDDAHGDVDGFVPSLRNQHYAYLVNQLHQLAEGYRHNADESLVRFLGSFDDEDLRATADYLSRLRGPGAVHKVMRSDGIVVD
jgi:cbb3-type cytochrome c oxidase subunit III